MNKLHQRRAHWLALGLVALGLGCGPRQAIVTSEPNPAARAGVGNEALTADLQRLREAQAEYRRDNGYYASSSSGLGFSSASGVRIDIIQGDRAGWSATATSGDFECALYEGEVRSPRGYLTEAGRIGCR